MDGSLKDLLPYLEDLPFDGLEALTAKPQGDVTLKELQESIGNKIFLDGIPSILFLPQYSYKYVKEYTDGTDIFYRITERGKDELMNYLENYSFIMELLVNLEAQISF